MELIISPEALRQEMKIFANLVARESALMEVSNIKLETADGRVYIYGTDLDVSLRTEIGEDSFEVVAPGAVCLKAHKLIDILGTLDSRVKSIRLREEQNGWTSCLFNRSHFKISGIKSELFPSVEFMNDAANKVAFPAGLLLQFIAATNYAVSNTDGRFTLSGMNLAVNNGQGAGMTATDGFRVASITADIHGQFTALIPKKAAAVLSRLLADVSPEVLVDITETDNQVFLAFGTKRMAFRKLGGDFPNTNSILGTQNEHKVLLNLYDLRSAIRRAEIFADKNQQSAISLTVRPGEIEVHARSFEEGSGNEVIEAKYDGPEVKLKLRSSFLVDFFNSVNNLAENSENNPVLSMEFSESDTTPTVWRVHRDGGAESGYDYCCVITKLR